MTDTTAPLPPVPPAPPADRPSWVRRHRTALLVAATIPLVAGLAYALAYVAVGSGVPRGTSVAGVPIGGLQPAVAAATLEKELADEGDIAVRLDGQERTVDGTAAGLSLDAAATVAAAGAREANPITLLRQLLGQEVDPVVGVDQDALDDQLDRLARAVDDPVRKGRVFYDGTTPVAVEPRAGRELDRAAAAELLTGAFLRQAGPVDLPLVDVAPPVTAEQVREVAATTAVTAVSAPITLVAEGRGEVVIEPSDLASSLTFVPDGGELAPKLSVRRLHLALADQLAAIEDPAVDARFDVSSGTPVVVPSRDGLGIDHPTLTDAVLGSLTLTGVRTVPVTLVPIPADLTTKEARELGITEVISSYTQYFPYAAYRVTNIGVAARTMNGTVLEPGETFSLNGIVGERTPENGFVKGYIIVGNRLVEDYGGAVSTITTATWHAAFFAGMTRIEQRAHGFWISRYTPGLEATVSWGNLDLKWRNDTPYGVLVTTAMTNESVTVTLWSTRYWDITAEFGPRTNPRPAGLVYDDSTGCVPQEGVDGFDITVTRVWSRDGEVERREPLSTSYSSAPTVVCQAPPQPKPSRSTDGRDPKPTATASPSPSPTG